MHKSEISVNFSGGMDKARFSVSNKLPKHIICVLGGHSLLWLTASPSSSSKDKGNSYGVQITEGKQQ